MTEQMVRTAPPEKMDRAREATFRNLIMQTVQDEYVAPENLICLSESTDEWYEYDCNRWKYIHENELGARISKRLHELADVNMPALGKTQGWAIRNGDTKETLSKIRARVLPIGWERVPERDRAKPFDLYTGRTFKGCAFQNCVVWVDAAGAIQKQPLSKDIFVKNVSEASYLEVPEGFPDSQFKEWLQDILPDEETVTAMQAQIGALMLGEMPTHQKMMLLIGEAGAGKGQLIQLITMLCGKESAASVRSPSQLANRFAMNRFRNKSLMVIADLPRRPRGGTAQSEFDDGMGAIKNLVGQDPVDVEIKNGAATSMELPLGVIAATNFAPSWISSQEDMGAWLRRTSAFKFTKKADNPIPDFAVKTFGPELSDIAYECIDAYAQLKEKQVNDIRSQWQKEYIQELAESGMNDYDRFIKKCIAPGDQAFRVDIKSAYKDLTGNEAQQRDSVQIFKRIRERFDVSEHGRGDDMFFLGVQLVEEID